MYLPDVIETVGRNKKSFTIPTKLFDNDIITLFGEITEEVAYSVISQIILANIKDTNENIKLYINSPGGYVSQGLAILDTIKSSRRKVDVIALGNCASMASAILSCTTGERKALKNTRLMYHSVSAGFEGTVHDYKINFKEVEYLQNILISMIVESSKNKITLEEFEKYTQRDYYLSPDEAIKLGLMDTVIPYLH